MYFLVRFYVHIFALFIYASPPAHTPPLLSSFHSALCVNKLHKIVFRGFCFHRILRSALFLLRFKYLDYIPVNEFQKRHRVVSLPLAWPE